MNSQTFYGTRSSSTIVEHQVKISFENDLYDGDNFEPDDSSSLGDSSADDLGDISGDEISNENEDTINQTLMSDWKPVTVSDRSSPFTGKEELSLHITANGEVKPIDIFELIIKDEIIDYIVFETNRFASQQVLNSIIMCGSYGKRRIHWNCGYSFVFLFAWDLFKNLKIVYIGSKV